MRALGALLAGALSLTMMSACVGAEQSSGGPCDVKVSTDTSSAPDITIPDCDKPTAALESRDIVVGSGDAAKVGDAVEVHYTGVSWSTKKQFDSSWTRGRPFVVRPLGQAGVIQGWNQGLIGVKVGSRRLLVIPASLGYGETGSGPNILPGETLVFVVDVVSINGGK